VQCPLDRKASAENWHDLPIGRRGGWTMEITVSEDVYRRLEEVKEWLESQRERDVTLDEVLVEILDHFEIVEHPEDLGSG